MIELPKITDERTYTQFAGQSWPPYADFIKGVRSEDESINLEISNFIDIMQERVTTLRIGEGDLLGKENQERQGQVFYAKTVTTHSLCRRPWDTLGINRNGEVFICSSPSWVPIFVGNILEVDNIYDILNNEKSKSIRREIINNRYLYCNEKLCAFFHELQRQNYNINVNDVTPSPDVNDDESLLLVDSIPINLIIDFDYTCNFKCPSCRMEVVNWNDDYLIRPINDRIVEKIKTLIIDVIDDEKINIRWCGGEPFISGTYLELFQYIIDSKKTNIQNTIHTNGSRLHTNLVTNLLPYIKELRVSFDAGTADTYHKIRVNGKWDKLLSNVKHIKEQINASGANTTLVGDFVVQLDNYKEIPKFKELCSELGIPRYHLQKMWNWGTWDTDTFKKNNVYDETHPLYNDLKKYL